MSFETQSIGNVLVVTLFDRRLDASVSAQFKEDIQAMIAQGTHHFVLDFDQVDFIDSSFLGTLVSLLKALHGKSELAVCSLNNNIQYV